MKILLNSQHKVLHRRAIRLCQVRKRVDWKIISTLQEAEATQLYKAMKCHSLAAYAIKHLPLDRSVALSMITIARKAAEVSLLQQSLKEGKLTSYMASRLVSALTCENAESLIDFAETHTCEQVDREVARLHGKVNAGKKYFKCFMSFELEDKINRVVAITSQNASKSLSQEEVLAVMADFFLKYHDPVLKAERAAQRKTKKHCVRRVRGQNHSQEKRVPLTAGQKHAVNLRDRGRCTFIDENGNRCTHDRFLHTHHIKHVSYGAEMTQAI